MFLNIYIPAPATKLTPTIAYPATATFLTPMRSLSIPQSGHATNATSSSAKPRVPTASPTRFFCPMRSVMTKEMEELRKTRKEMLKTVSNEDSIDELRVDILFRNG